MCMACPAGSSTLGAEGSSSCTLCQRGFFAPAAGMAECQICDPGTIQLELGGTSCGACPAEYSSVPYPLQTTLETSVCSGLVRAVVINWGSLSNPALLAANVTVVNQTGIPDWLTVRASGLKIVTFSSDLIPAGALLGGPTVNVTLAVTDTCLSSPWYGTVSVELTRVDPQLLRDSRTSPGGVQACPDFVVEYSAMLGTCPLETVVVAMLANGSALPPYATYSFGNGMLVVTGTVPPGTLPFDIVGVALLGNETFPSANPTTVTLAPPDNIQVVTTLYSVQACPYVSVVFSVTRGSSCGQLKFGGTLSNGSMLPPFLSIATNANSGGGTVTISGRVPDNYPDFGVIVSASTSASVQYSNEVTITRPRDSANANVSLRIGTAQRNVSSTTSVPTEVSALYGTDLRITAAIESGTERLCSSLGLELSVLDPDLQRTPTLTDLPPWISVTAISSTAVLISSNPTSDIAPGTAFVLYVWANDDKRNPGFKLTIVTELSLKLLSSATGGGVPAIQTPASLLEMQLAVAGTTSLAPVFVCPTNAAAAFCSVGANAGSLGAFGTPAGINDVLQGLSISLPPDANTTSLVASDGGASRNITLRLLFKESANPNPLVIQVPLSVFQVYTGVSQAKPLALVGTVGKLRLEPIAPFFHAGVGVVSVTYVLTSNASWLTIQSGYIGGTPPSPPEEVSFTVTARDAYTRVVANGVVNVSWPLPPVVNAPALSHWYMPSSTQVDIQLPLDLIVDPQNGTITFDLQLYTGSQILQPLPLFLTFDANNLRISGTPLAGDVGMYPLFLIGTSRWGSWKGNNTFLLTITVTQSWTDFFKWVYTIVGYCISGLGSLTAALVYRALIINVLMFKRRSRKCPPPSFCKLGKYKLEHEQSAGDGKVVMLPVPAEDVEAIFAIWLKHPAKPLAWYQFEYLEVHNRSVETKAKPELLTGPEWLRARVIRARKDGTQGETIDLVVNVPLLKQLVAEHQAELDDEYYVEVLMRGRWLGGMIIETFTFTIESVIDADSSAEDLLVDDELFELEVDRHRSPALDPDNELVVMLRGLSARLQEAENETADMKHRLVKAESSAAAAAALQPSSAAERRNRLDPYTGLPILFLPGGEIDDDDEEDAEDEEEAIAMNSDDDAVDLELDDESRSGSTDEDDASCPIPPPSAPTSDDDDDDDHVEL